MIPSRVSTWKGHTLFLNYLSSINLSDKLKFKIIFFTNCSKQKHFLKKVAEKNNLDKQLIVLNETQNIRVFYYLSDIIISMSIKEEGFGRTISESLAMKKIVIAPNNGGTKEQLEKFDKNLLYVSNNLDSFKKALYYALKNKDNNKDLRREYIISNFSIENMLVRTHKLYEK